MPVSKKGYDDRINTLISSVDSVNDAANLAGAYAALNNVDFPTYANPSLLPAASENTGRWVYVTSIQQLLFSDGFTWNNDFTSTVGSINSLWGFGGNTNGNLATNTTISYSSPVQEVSSSYTWTSFSALDDNSPTVYGIKKDGTLWAWGTNAIYGLTLQGSASTPGSHRSPVQELSSSTDWSSVSVGITHGVAIKTDGTLWAWGRNNDGALGTGDVICYSSPVQETTGGTTWSSVSASTEYTVALKTDGTLWSWGNGSSGRLGNDLSAGNQSSPVQEASSSTNWSVITCGDVITAAIKTDGTLWLWGDGTNGKLGNNNTINYSSPIQEASSSTNWSTVSTRGVLTGDSVAAIKTDGTLWAWGRNFYGEIGNDTAGISYSSPVQEVSSSTNWSSVSIGAVHTAAIKTDGTLWTWGYNNNGQLGTGNLICYSSPVQEVSSSTDWSSVEVTYFGTLGFRSTDRGF